MKKNGFTLVELLAVIVIIGVVMSLSVTMILNAKGNTENALSNEQVKAIKDAGKLLGVDLDDYYSEVYNCNDSSWIKTTRGVTCTLNGDVWREVTLSVDNLKAHGYFQDDASHCSGNVKIVKTDNEYNISLDNVKC